MLKEANKDIKSDELSFLKEEEKTSNFPIRLIHFSLNKLAFWEFKKTPFNIVLDRNFPDPTFLKLPNLPLIGYSTESVRSDGRILKIQGAVQRSRGNFDLLENDMMEGNPGWTNDLSCVWAPDVRFNKIKNNIMMFYAFGLKDGSFGISIAESDNPFGGFIDKTKEPIIIGKPEQRSTHIDPFVRYNKEGNLMLLWGSNRAPLMERQLTDDGRAFAQGSKPEIILETILNTEYDEVVEAGSIVEFNGVEYLFYSGKDCFANEHKDENGVEVDHGYTRYGNYAVLYAIRNPKTGNFERPLNKHGKLDNVLIEGNRDFKNPGHNYVLKIRGKLKSFSHVIKRDDRYLEGSFHNKRVLIETDIVQKLNGKLYVRNGRYSEEKRRRVKYFDIDKQPAP